LGRSLLAGEGHAHVVGDWSVGFPIVVVLLHLLLEAFVYSNSVGGARHLQLRKLSLGLLELLSVVQGAGLLSVGYFTARGSRVVGG